MARQAISKKVIWGEDIGTEKTYLKIKNYWRQAYE